MSYYMYIYEYIYIYTYIHMNIYIYIYMIYIYIYRHSHGEPKLLAISGIVHQSVRKIACRPPHMGLRYIFLENR